jgi:hypothetical protein
MYLAARDEELNRLLWDLFFPLFFFRLQQLLSRFFLFFLSFDAILTFATLWLPDLPPPPAEQQGQVHTWAGLALAWTTSFRCNVAAGAADPAAASSDLPVQKLAKPFTGRPL